ncbi:MAG: hypothetical protein ACRDDX_11555 [Cellulosilyticaceae bacterium]
MLNQIVHCEENMFNGYLNNLLHGLWKCPQEVYQTLVNEDVTIDFQNAQQLKNICRLFAVVRYVAVARHFTIKYPEIFYDEKLYLEPAYIAGPTYGKKSVKMLFTAPQAFYDYNVFYDTYSLTTL